MVNTVRKTDVIGLGAWVAAWMATALAPVHALSRYATVAGREDLDSPMVRAWAEPAARLLRPLLNWSDPETVYVTYGKAWFLIFLAATLCAFAVRRRREPRGAERWGWRIALSGYVLATASTLGDYWTPWWMDQSFLFLGIPGVLISLFGSTLLGAALLRRAFLPRTTGWLLVAWIPLFFGLTSVMAMGAAALPMIWAWGLAGRYVRRHDGASVLAVGTMTEALAQRRS